jgi:D-3-phosphoglycerate dehydrogenase
MKLKRSKLLYVYRERVPQPLRELVLLNIPTNEFEVEGITYSLSEKEMCKKMQWADMVLFAPGRYLPENIFRNACHIRLMQLWSSGYDKFNIKDAHKYDIPVANNGGANATSVAEHTILLMLAVYKWLPDSHNRTVNGKWEGNSHGMDMFLLHQKTLGIIGFGNIGREVARRAAGFGMNIIYFDPLRADVEIERSLNAKYEDMDTVLSNADILTLHLHLNENTRLMIGQKEFKKMKDSVVLINVSRAQLIDKRALIKALSRGKIWGVGLDVYDQEPTTANDPLLTHSRIVATPHMAGSTYDAYENAIKNAIANLRRVAQGINPLWVVNGVN